MCRSKKESTFDEKDFEKVDDARLGRAVAGLLEGSIKVFDVRRDDRGTRARIRGARDEFTVYIEGKQVYCSCLDINSHGIYCKHIAAVTLHELGTVAKARSERRELMGLMLLSAKWGAKSLFSP